MMCCLIMGKMIFPPRPQAILSRALSPATALLVGDAHQHFQTFEHFLYNFKVIFSGKMPSCKTLQNQFCSFTSQLRVNIYSSLNTGEVLGARNPPKFQQQLISLVDISALQDLRPTLSGEIVLWILGGDTPDLTYQSHHLPVRLPWPTRHRLRGPPS